MRHGLELWHVERLIPCQACERLMDLRTKLTLAVAALLIGAYIVGIYVDCAYDENCKIEASRRGVKMVRTAPSRYF